MRMARLSAALIAVGLLAGAPSSAIAAPSDARAAPSPGPTAPTATGPRPDVMVILLDDMPRLDGRLWRFLPNIRRLFVDQGVHFTRMFVESPLCCPGRAGWLTGQHTFNHGVTRNDVRLLDPSMTLATQLDGIGYHTIWAGKYFNQYPAIAPSVPPGWDHFHGMAGGYYDYTIWNDGDPDGEEHGRRPRDYSTDVIGAKVLAHIRSAPRNASLATFASWFSVHGPMLPAPRHADEPECATIDPWKPANYNEPDVSDKPAYIRSLPRLNKPAYDLVATCRMMLSVDEWVGAIRAELESQGRFRNTVFVITSDNGMNAGAHRMLGKSTPYATQVPFFMRWDKGLGSTSREFGQRLSNIDLAPTICELAGCEMGPYPNGQQHPDGRSFAGVLLGSEPSMGRDALLEDMPDGAGIVPPWYAAATTALSPLADVGCAEAASGGCRWHYVEYDTGERELYDVSNGPCWRWERGEPGDPCELHDLAGRAKYQAIQSALAARLAELKAEFGGPP
jgi:arylsulfatase A-like enzyme